MQRRCRRSAQPTRPRRCAPSSSCDSQNPDTIHLFMLGSGGVPVSWAGQDYGVYLFANVLDRFLGCYTSINSFCQLAAHCSQRKEPLGEWPPKAGYKPLI